MNETATTAATIASATYDAPIMTGRRTKTHWEGIRLPESTLLGGRGHPEGTKQIGPAPSSRLPTEQVQVLVTE